jgi:hypothetical protein
MIRRQDYSLGVLPRRQRLRAIFRERAIFSLELSALGLRAQDVSGSDHGR